MTVQHLTLEEFAEQVGALSFGRQINLLVHAAKTVSVRLYEAEPSAMLNPETLEQERLEASKVISEAQHIVTLLHELKAYSAEEARQPNQTMVSQLKQFSTQELITFVALINSHLKIDLPDPLPLPVQTGQQLWWECDEAFELFMADLDLVAVMNALQQGEADSSESIRQMREERDLRIAANVDYD